MAASFDTLQRSKAILYGDCAGIWVMLLFGPPFLADIQPARLALKAMSERHPQGFPTLTWVLPSAGLSMDAESRKLSSELTAHYAPFLKAQATLIEGEGFQAAAVRAIISGIDMMSRSRAPKKTFGELLPCLEWCLSRGASPGSQVRVEDVHIAMSNARKPLG